MQVQVTGCSDIKTNEKGTSSKMICGDKSYWVQEDATAHIGKTVEIEVAEKTSQAGRKYMVAKITKVLTAAQAPASNGRVKWEDYKQIAKAAHELALELEPDGISGSPETPLVTIDRSQARIAFVQTALVALRDGRIELPAAGDDGEIPF